MSDADKSRRAIQYAVIPASVLFDQSIEPAAARLYGVVSLYTRRSGACWASNAHLARLFDVTEDTVKRWIQSLVKAQHLRSVVTRDTDGTRRMLYLSDAPDPSDDPDGGVVFSPPPGGKKATHKSKRVKKKKDVTDVTDADASGGGDDAVDAADVWPNLRDAGHAYADSLVATFERPSAGNYLLAVAVRDLFDVDGADERDHIGRVSKLRRSLVGTPTDAGPLSEDGATRLMLATLFHLSTRPDFARTDLPARALRGLPKRVLDYVTAVLSRQQQQAAETPTADSLADLFTSNTTRS